MHPCQESAAGWQLAHLGKRQRTLVSPSPVKTGIAPSVPGTKSAHNYFINHKTMPQSAGSAFRSCSPPGKQTVQAHSVPCRL